MLSTNTKSIFVTCPKGLNYILEKELQNLGAKNTKSIPAGVHAQVDKRSLYTILLWSRIANRVILPLNEAKVETIEDVYKIVYEIDWPIHFDVTTSFSVNFVGTNQLINNSEFGAFKVKDAIVDRFRDDTNERPSVDRKQPQIRITAHLAKGSLSVGIDLSGESLHKRGYRTLTGKAPLKENLAAGILMLSGWPSKFNDDASFVDPMCGSGTFMIEAAMMAYDKAPGLNREDWGFDHWKFHDEKVWSAVSAFAKDRLEAGLSKNKRHIIGFDQDSKVISRAWENITAAGFDNHIHVEKKPLEQFEIPAKLPKGLVMTNPPYGERLGTIRELISLYQNLGNRFEEYLIDWKAAVFTGNIDLGKSIGWRSHKQYKLLNGAIESQLILVDLIKRNRFKDVAESNASLKNAESWKISNEDRAKMFENRCLKNYKSLSKWAKKQNISCFRLYDADMPEFSVAVDLYQSVEGERYLHVQEYQAPKSVPQKVARERLSEALFVLGNVINERIAVKKENISVKQRSIQKGLAQYEKEGNTNKFIVVEESGIKLKVNLYDYLDTGLFLDHRPTRKLISSKADGKRFLNLFSYTGVATLHAIAGGAESTLSVDMSKTYLNWLEDNLDLNKFDRDSNKVNQADCLAWLENGNDVQAKFDLIFLDPPSFSNSKRMDDILDIQRDHIKIVDGAMAMLSDNGELIFSNNLRKFKLSEELIVRYQVQNITAGSFDPDFSRNKHIHQVWSIKSK